eukprot:69569-Amphidinium_carterae.1
MKYQLKQIMYEHMLTNDLANVIKSIAAYEQMFDNLLPKGQCLFMMIEVIKCSYVSVALSEYHVRIPAT